MKCAQIKSILFLLLSFSFTNPTAAQKLKTPTTSDFQSVFWVGIDRDNHHIIATAFMVVRNGRQYFATARHFADSLSADSAIEFFYEGAWHKVTIRVVGRGDGQVDISVFTLRHDLIPIPDDLTPIQSKDDLVERGSEVWVLGFPLGLQDPSRGSVPNALLTHGYFSGASSAGVLYLDYHNNFGSSGSPVYARDRNGKLRLFAVLSAYQSEEVVGDTAGSLTVNSDIALAILAQNITLLIDANPIGLRVK